MQEASDALRKTIFIDTGKYNNKNFEVGNLNASFFSAENGFPRSKNVNFKTCIFSFDAFQNFFHTHSGITMNRGRYVHTPSSFTGIIAYVRTEQKFSFKYRSDVAMTSSISHDNYCDQSCPV